MNILIDPMPISIRIKDRNYKINSDFRVSILFEMLMQDDELTEQDKIVRALNLYYPIIPKDIDEAIKKIIYFYKCGKDEEDCKGNKSRKVEEIYSFDYDDEYIYSAFLSQYAIDLQDIEYLHWWKFKALFKSLKEDNMIVKIMGYRSTDIASIKDKNQKAYYKRMKKIYEIPHSKKEKEKINAIEEVLMNGGSLNNLL